MFSLIIDGVERFFGNVTSPTPRSYRWNYVGDSESDVPMVSRAELKPTSIDLSLLPPVKDQDGIGACNAFATTEVMETCRAVQGLPYVELSPGWLYGNINGQRDSGSMLEDAAAWGINHGICTAASVPPLQWQQSKWRNPTSIEVEASAYKFLELWKCPSGDELTLAMASALMRGCVLDSGCLWYSNYNIDGDGKLPKRGSGQAGGHAFMLFGFDIESDGIWFHARQSWGRWGINGNFRIHESAYTSDIGGIYACRAVSDVGGSMPTPVV